MATYVPPTQRREKSPHLPFGEMRQTPFYGKDILSVSQFDREKLEYVFGVAEEMRSMVEHVGTFDLLKGKILANLFYEPSTRTSSSFMAAMQRLGGSVIPINEVRYSSVAKGESLPDTVRTLESYADVIVIRHPEVGSAAIAAMYARKPVINAGDGVGEHPTQALLDLFTIREELGRTDELTVTMLGDLKYGRTVHSLSRLLAQFQTKLHCVSPDILRMPPEFVAELKIQGMSIQEHTNLDEVLPETDVLYVTRVQKERFEDQAVYESVKGAFVVTPEILKLAKDQMIVMHPLPRVGEIAMDCGRRSARGLLPPDGIRAVHPHGAPGDGAGESVGDHGPWTMDHGRWPIVDGLSFEKKGNTPMTKFSSLLDQRARKVRSLLCVGLDPHPELLAQPTASAALEFCLRIIRETSDLALAFKPNSAFFEAFGPEGIRALQEVIGGVPRNWVCR